ncbi:YbiU family protein, partial [Cronobacter malonaticus]
MTLHISDLPSAIREIKQQLRQALPNYQAVFAELEADIARQIETIKSETARGESPVPQIQADYIINGRISDAQKARIRERGCCVIKGVFPESQARAWN